MKYIYKNICILFSIFLFLIVFPVFTLQVNASGSTPDKPVNTRINLLEHAYGIDPAVMRFSWASSDADSSDGQSAYRIVIGTSSSNMSSGIYFADSGWISESSSTGISFPDLENILEYDSLYYWSVQIKDRFGNASELSTPSAFTTAINNNWDNTDGIWGDTSQSYMFFRTQFNIRKHKTVEKAFASVSAASGKTTRQYVYDFYVDGSLAGVGPGRSDGTYVFYNNYDITNLIKNDPSKPHTVGAICYTEDVGSFLCQIHLFYTDGTSEIVASTSNPSDWQCLDGDNIFGYNGTSIGSSSYYTAAANNMNATLYPFGWESNKDNSSWNNAIPSEAPFSADTLIAYPSENMTRTPIKPASVTKIDDQSYVIDLGKEITGSLLLNIDMPSSDSITISYGEELNPNGTVKYKLLTGNTYREYWTLKAGEQSIGDISMKCFRYVQIDNLSVEITDDMICGMALKQDFDSSLSRFSSTNNVLNDVYNLCKYTIEATSQDLYVDTQSRERRTYEGDILITMLSSYSFTNNYSLARHSMSYILKNPTWPAEYQLYTINAAWQDYLTTGDDSFISGNYQALKSCLYESCFDSDMGLMHNPEKQLLIDWPYSERDNFDTSVAYNTVFNAVCAGAYNDMANIAASLGYTADAAVYANRASVLKNSLIAKLYDTSTHTMYDGLYEDGSRSLHTTQHDIAFALAFGVYSDQEMANALAAKIKNDGELKVSVYAAFFLLKGLYESNNGDIGRMILSNPNTQYSTHSWAYMMYNQNATITTEAWSPSDKSNMSYSHAWGSAPASALVRGMFGIYPTSAGYETFQVKIQPGGIASSSVTVPTVKGSISASYEIMDDQKLQTTLAVPFGSTAAVYLPCNKTDYNNLIVNGTAVSSTMKDGYFYIELGSGTYTIISDSGLSIDTTELEPDLKPSVSYQTHVQSYGWQNNVNEGEISGTTGSAKRLEAIRINLKNQSSYSGSIQYRTYVQTYGWLDWVNAGEQSGTSGEGKRMEAIRIELTGELAENYDIYYRVHAQSFGWLDWAKNGECAGTAEYAKRLEAIQIIIVNKDSAAPGSTDSPFLQKQYGVFYQTHVQSIGWMNEVSNEELSGTSGQAKRLEAIRIRIAGMEYAGGITYRTHVQSYGWMDWVNDGQLSGTSGQAKRLEAIQLMLTGELAEYYDIEYRVHVQSYGWMDWVKNGEAAGTSGEGKRLEAIQIRLVKKELSTVPNNSFLKTTQDAEMYVTEFDANSEFNDQIQNNNSEPDNTVQDNNSESDDAIQNNNSENYIPDSSSDINTTTNGGIPADLDPVPDADTNQESD